MKKKASKTHAAAADTVQESLAEIKSELKKLRYLIESTRDRMIHESINLRWLHSELSLRVREYANHNTQLSNPKKDSVTLARIDNESFRRMERQSKAYGSKLKELKLRDKSRQML